MASRVIPTSDSPTLATYKILSDGTDIGFNYGVLGITVSKGTNKIPSAQILLSDGSVAQETFELSSEDLFVPGKEIEIQLGYNSNDNTVFKGIVIKHGIKTLKGQTSVLRIEVKDVAVKMTVGRKNKYFEEVTDSDIIEEIIGGHRGISADVEAISITHQEMVQYYVTDWDFMMTRAEANGMLVFVNDGTISIKAPDLSPEAPVELAYGHNVIDFEAEMDARDQFATSTSTSWDYTNQEVVEEEGADPGLDEQGNINASELSKVIGLESLPQIHSGKVVDEELKAWSDGKLIRSRLAKIKGKVQCIGFSEIKPGDTLELAGFGDRFNGKVFVSNVIHSFSGTKSWYTTIEFGLDQEWFATKYRDVFDVPASGLVPPIHGLQNGVVTNIHEDPDGEFRVRVRIPVIDSENEGVWARVATLDAGDNRGTFFRPEVEDEVIVGFLNDDPRDPVILGMVHSTNKPSPLTPEEENNEKGLVTRSELKMLFNDDLNTITFETPAGNKIVLSEDEGGILIEDENGNKVEMTSDGINIESAGDITMKASGDVTIEGTNVTTTANSQYLAEGNSGAEISSGGQTVVKGSLVAIN